MKVVKKLFIGTLLIAITAGFVHGIQPVSKVETGILRKVILKHFSYTLYPNTNPIYVNDPDSYMLTSDDGTEPFFCSPGAFICGVIAEDDGTGHPDFVKPFTFVTRN